MAGMGSWRGLAPIWQVEKLTTVPSVWYRVPSVVTEWRGHDWVSWSQFPLPVPPTPRHTHTPVWPRELSLQLSNPLQLSPLGQAPSSSFA